MQLDRTDRWPGHTLYATGMADEAALGDSPPPTVSVIICTHRRPHLLPRAVQSVLGQKFDDLEVIIVDDASGDETPRVIQGFLDDARVVHLENATNLGLPGSRNRGLQECRGRFVAFLDDDDEWHPDKLDLQVHAMASSPAEVGAIWSHSIWIGANGSKSARRIRLNGYVHRRLQRHDIVMMQPLLVRRTVFDAVGMFDPLTSSYEDFEFSLRLAKKFSFRTVDEDLVFMHYTPGSMSQNHARSAEVLKYLLGKPDTLTDRNARGRWWVRVASHYAMLGDHDAWRVSLRQARRSDPWSLRPWVMLFIGRIGGPLANVRLARLRNRLGRRTRSIIANLSLSRLCRR